MKTLTLACLVSIALTARADDPSPLPGTAPLDWDGDLASKMVEGIDRFLLRKTDEAEAKRAAFRKPDFSSAEAYKNSIEPNRKRLAHILGVRDGVVGTFEESFAPGFGNLGEVGRSRSIEVSGFRARAFGEVSFEGLLLRPLQSGKTLGVVVAIPDSTIAPEQLVGLAPGVPPEEQYARRLAESGFVVLVPALIDRGVTHKKLSNREFFYRSAYEMGRHLIGYEIQKVRSVAIGFHDVGDEPVGVIGWGDGGMLAMEAAALEPRIKAACVSGYFGERKTLWTEPIDRNVFGLLERFGDAEIASMIAPGP